MQPRAAVLVARKTPQAWQTLVWVAAIAHCLTRCVSGLPPVRTFKAMQTAAMPCFPSHWLHLRSPVLSQASSVMNPAVPAVKQQRCFARGKLIVVVWVAGRKPLAEVSLGLQRAYPARLGIASSEHFPRPQPVRTRTQERRALDERPPSKTVAHGKLRASHVRPGTVVACKTAWSMVRRSETKPVRQKPYQITPAEAEVRSPRNAKAAQTSTPKPGLRVEGEREARQRLIA